MTSTMSSVSCAPQMPFFVREAEAARLLGVSIGLLRKWRQHGGGPRVGKLNASVVYPLVSLREFADAVVASQGAA